MTNPSTDFLSDRWLSIVLLFLIALHVAANRSTSQCRCGCPCSPTNRPVHDDNT